MLIDYVNQFPIPKPILTPKLRALLEPVGDNPALRVEVTARWEKDHYGPNREYVHMILAAVPETSLVSLGVARETTDGVVCFSVPAIERQGGLATFAPSISSHDYIVASWGDGSFYSYALSDKVWMALGLSPRVLGGEQQQIIYDDLSLPEFGVAEGGIATQHYYSSKRDIQWTMSNSYLRRYLWMRGAIGVRAFFYEALLPESKALRLLMGCKSQILLAPKGGWYELDTRNNPVF